MTMELTAQNFARELFVQSVAVDERVFSSEHSCQLEDDARGTVG